MLQQLVENARHLVTMGYYQPRQQFNALPSLAKKLHNDFTIIGEIKPASPTTGALINPEILSNHILEICNEAGAISVLTEPFFFKGELEFLDIANQYGKPVLMKDIIIDKKQIDAANASAILLIKKALSKSTLQDLLNYAKNSNLEVVLEVDNEHDLIDTLDSFSTDILAINNRNLTTFEVDPTKSTRLIQEYDPNLPVLGLSGYSKVDEIIDASESGLAGILIGTALSKSMNPGMRLREFNRELRLLS